MIEYWPLIKFSASVFFAVVVSSCATACGYASPGGYVLGTTGFLQEANRGRIASRRLGGEGSDAPMEAVSTSERAALARRLEAGR